jgi:FlgD Ig-like domain
LEEIMYYFIKFINSGIPRQFYRACFTLLAVLIFYLPIYGQPSNDECPGATAITGIPFTDNVNTTTATNNPADPILSCNAGGGFTDGNTVWYVWTPTNDITINFSTDGSTEPDGDPLDTSHGIFTGTCGSLSLVACVDIGLTDNLVFEATGGVTYYIKFGEFLDGIGGGNLVVTVDIPPPPEQFVLESVRDGESAPISNLVTLPKKAAGSGTVQEIPMFMKNEDEAETSETNRVFTDRLREKMNQQKSLFPPTDNFLFKGGSGPELLQIFNGVENDDNDALNGFLVFPPDTDGDVGPNHYVQMTNLVTTIYDKSGNTLLGPFPNNIFWTGLGGRSENTNSGDPIVLYDEETDRWLVSQFALDNTGFSLGIAISTTSDPTGSYYQHEFDFTAMGLGLPDYPKYGFVSDAIGVMANLFVPFQGAGLGAIDKAEAFSSNPTTMVFYKLGTNEFGFVAGDNDGPVFDNMKPTFFTNNGGSGNRIDVWEITPDFNTPINSTISEVARIPVSPFDIDLCGAIRERCIDQPEGAPRLESITDRLMHRLQLRDFGKDKRAMVNHTIDDDGNGKAGIRWYEFRNHKDRGWTLFKENTFSPDGDHRWMGSIAMNDKGETCLGYSISSTTTYPSIGVAGRLGEANHMNAGELLVFDGNIDQHVQLGTAARWGDYSAMAVDPVDGTFWYTQEYAKPNTRLGELAGWATKIAQISMKSGKLVKDAAEEKFVPETYALLQNYPNPFNPETVIGFQLPNTNHVTVKIFNSLGQEIRTLIDHQLDEGVHNVRWDGKDNHGIRVSSDIYFYKFKAGSFMQVNKMNLLR